MKNIVLPMALLCSSVAVAGSVEAAGSSVKAASENPWEGFYVGGNIGADWGDYHLSANYVPGDNALVDTPLSGYSLGGQMGINFVRPDFFAGHDSLVYGIEGSLDYSSLKGTKNLDLPGTYGDPPVAWSSYDPATVTVDTLAALRGRLGFAHDNTLLYATGGLAMAHLKLDGVGTGNLAFDTTVPDENWKLGWTIGAGLAQKLSEHWSAFGEYAFSDFGKSSMTATSYETGDFPVGQINGKNLTIQVATFGINYHW